MEVYFAKSNIGIPPYGIVTVGEVLKDHHINALGSERVEEMLKENVIGVQHDTETEPATIPMEEHTENTNSAKEAEKQEDKGETEEEADELVLPMDGLVKDAPEETGKKPEKNEKKGRAKQSENQDA